jgi:hypothetical protein
MAKKKVLLLGIDSKLIDPNLPTATGWDANRVRAAAQDANKRLVELGYELQSCLLDPTGTDEVLFQTHFQGKNLTASWLVLVLGYCRRIPVCLRKS